MSQPAEQTIVEGVSAPRITPDPELTDLAGVGVMLRISKRHAARMDACGQLPMGIRLGRSKRWRIGEIRDWVSAGCPPRTRWEVLKNASPKLRTVK